MRGSAVFRTGVAPGGALAGPWVRDPLWTRARAVPSLDLRFADNKSLVDAVTGASLVTFTRASSGTFVGSDGVLQSAVTNLLLRSEEFDNASWTKSATSITVNDSTSPAGSLTADKLVEDSANSQHTIGSQTISWLGNTQYTFTVYVKAAGRDTFDLLLGTAGNWVGSNRVAIFNLTSGTIEAQDGSPVVGSIQNVGDGWFRCRLTSTTVASPSASAVFLRLYNTSVFSGGASSYLGNGTSGVYIWGAQLEQSATVGEYIPTTSTINSAPRFDHSITSTTTNLLLQSNGFDTTWTNTNSSETSLSGTAPDGTNTAWELKDTSDVSSVVHALNQSVSFISGTAYTVSCWMKAGVLTEGGFTFPAGAFTSNISARVSLSTGVVITTSAGVTASTQQFSNGWWRVSATATATATASAAMQIRIMNGGFAYIGTGTGTILIYGAQLETGSTATPYVPTTTAAATSNTTDSLGLLVEEARTNSIRNNTMVGAVAGTPGTIPTNWTGSGTTAGITREIVGTGIENGINYIDYRIAGTTTGALFFGVSLEGSTSVAATNGQTWTFSSYARLIAGSLAGFTQINFYIVFNSSIGAALQFATGGITPTSAALNTQRFTRTGTASNALIAFVQPTIQLEAPTGTSIDITLRIGLPQLEQGATASSVIPTTTAAATRSADVASVGGTTFTSFYNQSGGTWFGDVFREFAVPASQFPVIVDCRTSGGSPDINQFSYLLEGIAGSFITVGGVSQSELYPTVPGGTRRRRIATAYAVNNFATCVNGFTPLIDSTGSVGNPLSMTIGAVIGGSQYLNGHIRRLTYWPQALPSRLQTLTQ